MDRFGRDEIFYAIVDRENKVLDMLETEENINFQDKNGYSYLHMAVQEGYVEVVIKLIELGCDIDIKDRFGKTPLMIAIASWDGENDSIIQILLKSGANINETTSSGVSCVRLAEMKGYSGLINGLI